jgi:hypothetical protein
MTFLLLVPWLAYGQPPSDYQVPFSSNEACEAARLQLIKEYPCASHVFEMS